MAAALPALAQDSNADALSRCQFQRSLQAAFAAPVLTASPSAVAAADVEVDPEPIMGKPGDAASWRTTEFNSDWGLQAINADVAYARGLTGTGIRLGVFDSGTGLDHDEFAQRPPQHPSGRRAGRWQPVRARSAEWPGRLLRQRR